MSRMRQSRVDWRLLKIALPLRNERVRGAERFSAVMGIPLSSNAGSLSQNRLTNVVRALRTSPRLQATPAPPRVLLAGGLSERCDHAVLPAGSCLLEEVEHVAVDAERDDFLRPRYRRRLRRRLGGGHRL